MAAVLVEYLDDAEPLTFNEVAAQCRLDDDEDEREFIEQIVIPGARQAAESKSGAAIRKARYVERLAAFPPGAFSLSVGQVLSVDSFAFRSACGESTTLATSTYELVQLGRESLLAPLNGSQWPDAMALTITYQAGIDLSRYPSVRSWMLLAAAWAYDHRELFARGQAVMAMPGGYADVLLAPICVPTRF
ncbi:head-tail connector protein [Caballeronia sp. HLA56]